MRDLTQAEDALIEWLEAAEGAHDDLPVLYKHDPADFGFHIRALHNIMLSRPTQDPEDDAEDDTSGTVIATGQDWWKRSADTYSIDWDFSR